MNNEGCNLMNVCSLLMTVVTDQETDRPTQPVNITTSTTDINFTNI